MSRCGEPLPLGLLVPLAMLEGRPLLVARVGWEDERGTPREEVRLHWPTGSYLSLTHAEARLLAASLLEATGQSPSEPR